MQKDQGNMALRRSSFNNTAQKIYEDSPDPYVMKKFTQEKQRKLNLSIQMLMEKRFPKLNPQSVQDIINSELTQETSIFERDQIEPTNLQIEAPIKPQKSI